MLPTLAAVPHALSAVLTVLGPGSPAGPVRVSWTAPVQGPVVVLQAFDPPPEPWLPGHRGVDLDAEVGDPVFAAGAGTVTWAAPIAGRGVVVVEHADGRRTT